MKKVLLCAISLVVTASAFAQVQKPMVFGHSSSEEEHKQSNEQLVNEYKSKIITIKVVDDLSNVLYSKDESTGFCWITAQTNDGYKINTMVPHMQFVSGSFPDLECHYFNKAMNYLDKNRK